MSAARPNAPWSPSPEAVAQMRDVPHVADALVDAYRRDGAVVVPGALPRSVLGEIRGALESAVRRCWPSDVRPMEDRTDVYAQAFIQVVNPAFREPAARWFVDSPRIAGIAAQLMGVPGVRLYSEDWLVKEAGAGYTPWHQDAAVFPFEPCPVVTAWLALEDMLPESGLLRLALGSHRGGMYPHDKMTHAFHDEIDAYVARQGYRVAEVPPLAAGDVSFHDGLTLHWALPNRSGRDRFQLALHMFADGAVVREPSSEWMAHALKDLGPGLRAGDFAASRSWRRLYPPPA